MTQFTSHIIFTLFLPIVFFHSFLLSFESNTQEHLSSISYESLDHQILEIDVNSIKTADELGGGVYYKVVNAIVPFFPLLVETQWLQYKSAVIKRMGVIESPPYSLLLEWSNTATSIDQLIKDADKASQKFWEMCLFVSQRTGCGLNAGPENRQMIKSHKRINEKVQKWMKSGLSLEKSVGKIRDALRATLVVERPEQIPSVIETLKDYAHSIGREFVFINVWNEMRASGYVGIHSKMLFPLEDEMEKSVQKNVIIEIQIHLKCMMDGTRTCAKEREHLLYNQMRMLEIDPKIQTAASMLIYLTALKKCPE